MSMTELDRLKLENERLKQSRNDYKRKWQKVRKRRDSLMQKMAEIEALQDLKSTINEKDNVKSPSHYTQGKYETIDVVRDVLGPKKFEGHCIGNVMKYVIRYPHKNGIEDLRKAQVYLGWAIETLERESE